MAAPAAGLSSSAVHKAQHRGTSCVIDREYPSPVNARQQLASSSAPSSPIGGAFSNTSRSVLGGTTRNLSPLKPRYTLPSVEPAAPPPASPRAPFASTSRSSLSLTTKDIPGAFPSPTRRPMYSRESSIFSDGPQGARTFTPRASRSLDTSDILGASARRSARPEVDSPGRGTLRCSDIPGAAPGNAHAATSATFMLGRWPAPATTQFQFSQQPRATMILKPVIQAP